jgi:purine-nucleoside phosphorylase
VAELKIYQKIQEAVDAIQARTEIRPEIGIILGSGLGSIADQVTDSVVIPYTDIPHFHGTSVEGNSGKMTVGNLHGIPTVFLQGRFHLYEGYAMEEVVFPTRVLCGLGIQTLILTNTAGSVNKDLQPGDLMLIEDHINLMGDNPLMGRNIAQLGPRFPDLSETYNSVCLETFGAAADACGITVRRGVYASLLGPTYETPAEVRMLGILGADAIGMSTVPEAIAATHLGVRVVGISCIRNYAAGVSPQKSTQRELFETSQLSAAKLRALIETALPRLVHRNDHPRPTDSQKELTV